MPTAFPAWPDTTWPPSLWRDSTTHWDFEPSPSTLQCDVCIVGAGFTGLWAAHHLALLDPSLSIVVLDAIQPGYGASGRNGGWCSALMPMSLSKVAASSSQSDAIALQAAMYRTIDDIGRFVTDNKVPCSWHHGGTLSIATNDAQLSRARSMVGEYESFGFGSDDFRVISGKEARARIACDRAIGAWYSPHCASLNPARLVDGIVRSLLEKGVALHGFTRVTALRNDRIDATTPAGPVDIRARWKILATEGFTASLTGHSRKIAPVHSYMIATEPLDAATWANIGWSGRETFSDGRHVVVYAQRTGDDRIAFGGRGAPYAFGSRVGPDRDNNPKIHDRLARTLTDLLPDTTGARITHRWGGALGVSRDWFTSVTVDETSGWVTAGGYAGDGVAFSHLAAEIIAHSIVSTGDAITRLPIVGHRSPSWEPEPLRWLGINGLLKVGSAVDALEDRNSPLATPGRWLLGKFLH